VFLESGNTHQGGSQVYQRGDKLIIEMIRKGEDKKLERR